MADAKDSKINVNHRHESTRVRSPPQPPRKDLKLLHIGTLGPGHFFGEIGIVQNLREDPISVISEGHVELFVLYKVNFQKREEG